MITFSVTYDVVTAESAEHGDFAEGGFYSEGGWKHEDRSEWSLRSLVSHFGRGGFEDSGTWFSSADADQDYRTGDYTSYAIHPPDSITASSYRRLRRIFCGRLTTV